MGNRPQQSGQDSDSPLSPLRVSARIPSKFFDGRGLIDQGVQDARQHAADRLLVLINRYFREQDLNATGRTVRSLRIRTTRSTQGWYTFSVFSNSDRVRKHLPYLENGMPPGLPINAKEFARWMQARKIPYEAFMPIVLSLERRGYRGKHPFREIKRLYGQEIRRIVDRDVKRSTRIWLRGQQ